MKTRFGACTGALLALVAVLGPGPTPAAAHPGDEVVRWNG